MVRSSPLSHSRATHTKPSAGAVGLNHSQILSQTRCLFPKQTVASYSQITQDIHESSCLTPLFLLLSSRNSGGSSKLNGFCMWHPFRKPITVALQWLRERINTLRLLTESGRSSNQERRRLWLTAGLVTKINTSRTGRVLGCTFRIRLCLCSGPSCSAP